MKRLLQAALLLALSAGVAWGGWNIRQNRDGTSDFVRPNVTGEEVAPIGRVVLTMLFDNISEASTRGVAVPITNARVSLIQSVLQADITTADAVFDFWIITGTTEAGVAASRQITNGSAGLTIAAGTAGAPIGQRGTLDTFTPHSVAVAQSNGLVDILERGSVILIHSDGGSTNSVSAHFTITIDPR